MGGLAVGLGGLLEPRALGVGYDVIGDLLQHHLVVSVALGLLLVKLMIWVIALGSGTSGGVLAPLLMIGAGLGSVLGSWLPGGGPELWALVCMAAILAGTMRAPLTAVVFARRGRHVYREYGVDPLERHFVDEVMTRDPLTIAGSLTPDEILHTHFGKNQRHRAYPVVADGQVVAMMDRNTLNDLAQEARDRPVAQRFADRHELVYALPSDTCRAVALKLAAHGLERLPVVSDSTTRELTGIISRSDLLKPARALHEEEVHRESFFWSKERNAHQKSS